MLYLDTSVIIPLLVAESKSDIVDHFLKTTSDIEFALSDWTITEVSSALSFKLRSGHISASMRDAALSQFNSTVKLSLHLLPVERHHFGIAAQYCDRAELKLRASDALHMAVAFGCAATLVSADKVLIAAARSLGHRCILL